MAPVPKPTSDEGAIRAAMDAWARAVHDKDVDAVMKLYADDFVGYDMIAPLAHRGAAAYRKVFQDWFAAIEGPIEQEPRDVRIAAGGEVAFAHGLFRMRSRSRKGGDNDYWIRVTIGLRKRGADWKIVHEHASVPFDMKTRKALLDIKP